MRLALCESESNPESIAQRFAQCVQQVLAEQQITQEKLLGIGIGVPGVVKQAEEETVSAPAWNWRPVPLKALLQKELSSQLYVDNGCKTMALAEMHLEPGLRHETLAALNIGTGVGAGIVYEEKLYRGGSNSAGEWGHTPMVLGGDLCRCGSYGCLEAYIGAPGIIRRLSTLSPTSAALRHGTEECIIGAIIQAAIQGDPAAHEIMQATSHYLGAGIANLINLFNPQRIILGGKIGLLLGQAYLPEIVQQARRYALKEPFEATSITVSSLGEDAASLGAARLALEGFMVQVGGGANFARLHM
ncbi:hypothetical protein KSX_60390 [Ktedonospora formicarum]|uniref:ROK family protein n=1 Tax=Ktedonospora formicarum TaxID=2778364 RepID=A0A8J3MVF1_9CHLR|nr:hypothetical protein KSX_60390 [Ktedonospora formicarum]